MLRRMTAAERERRRTQFLETAASQWDAMFDPARQTALQTFEQREEQAVQVAQTLGAQVLAQHLQCDELTAPEWPAQVPCPTCQTPAVARSPATAPPARDVRARVGEVAYPRPEYHCRRCRRSFFPGRPGVRARNRGL